MRGPTIWGLTFRAPCCKLVDVWKFARKEVPKRRAEGHNRANANKTIILLPQMICDALERGEKARYDEPFRASSPGPGWTRF